MSKPFWRTRSPRKRPKDVQHSVVPGASKWGYRGLESLPRSRFGIYDLPLSPRRTTDTHRPNRSPGNPASFRNHRCFANLRLRNRILIPPTVRTNRACRSTSEVINRRYNDVCISRIYVVKYLNLVFAIFAHAAPKGREIYATRFVKIISNTNL